MKHLDVAVAVIFRDSKVLIARRKADAVLGGFWEFPGGKCEPGETAEACIRREVREELDIHVRPVVCLPPLQHQYSDRMVTLHPYLCTKESGEPRLIACDEIRWIEPAHLRSFTFPPANADLIEQVIATFPQSPPAPEISIKFGQNLSSKKRSAGNPPPHNLTPTAQTLKFSLLRKRPTPPGP